MVDLAINHVEELQRQFHSTWFQEKYKFWNFTSYYEEWGVEESTWNKHQFVSLNAQGKVIGYIGYQINRANEVVECLNIINFTDNKVAFGMDVGQVLRDIFEKFYFRKVNFEVVIGNPIEKTYDRMIQRYGGRIVGIQKKQVKLIDGRFYDVKLYEIFRNDFLRKTEHVLPEIQEFKRILKHAVNEYESKNSRGGMPVVPLTAPELREIVEIIRESV